MLFSLLLGACGSTADEKGAVPGDSPDNTSVGEGSAPANVALDSDESNGFIAQVTSAISVDLSWTPVTGAQAYEIEGSIADLDYFLISTLNGEVNTFEVFPVPDEAQLNFRLTALGGDGSRSSRTVTVATPVEVPNPYSVEVTLEETQGGLIGFDPSTFDPSTFDPSTLDPSLFDPENLDLSSLTPQPLTVTQEIGPAGGTLTVTSTNGTVYRLTILEGALPYELDISMTPVASLGGLPAEVELVAAVQIEPEGFPLSAPAVLVITPAEATGISGEHRLVGIGFGSGGSDFHFTPLSGNDAGLAGDTGSARLASTVLKPNAIGPGGLSYSMLQSGGVATASPEAVQRTTRSNPPADRSRSSRQRAAASDASRSTDGDELAPLVAPFESWLAQNIENRAKDNQKADGTYRDLFEALADHEFLLDKWGDELSEVEKNRVWDALVEALYQRLKEAAEAACMTDAHMHGIQLAERLTKPASEYDQELLKRFTAKYGSDGGELIRKAMQLAERCPLFLQVQSDVTHYTMDALSIEEAKITAEVPLRWKFGGPQRQPYLIGKGRIGYEKKDIKLEDGCLAEPNTVSGSWFHVQRLSPTFNNDGTLDDFELEIYHATGRATDVVVIFVPDELACVMGPQGNKTRGADFWWSLYGIFMMVHGGFPIHDWSLRAEAGMSTLAEKTISNDGDTIVMGTMSGSTKFILVNKGAK